ncbi:MAG: hypothetical protein ACLFMM_01610 [Methanohalobium sp.]|uniref:hypothetical protein n=1 Tax=Methanohalobium sp. TaxID=2837493 RepID=UPI00397B84B3
MVVFRSGAYTLKTRPDIIETEKEFRDNMDLSQVNGVLFNVLALKNSSVLAEYDAMMWKENQVWFVEYKDSVGAVKRMNAKRAQQVSDTSRNLARIFGFAEYNFTIVVNGLEEETIKGGATVLPLRELNGFEPEYYSAYVELDYINKLLEKYSRDDYQSEVSGEKVLSDLNKLKNMIEQNI